MFRRTRSLVRRLIDRLPFRHPKKKWTILLISTSVIGAVLLFLIGFLWIGLPSKTPEPITVGVTFSIPYAKELGLNWRETLTATLDDLGVRTFRIPAYWSEIEKTEGKYDWSEIDYQMNEIALRNGKVVLAVGAKLPRWPECWIPTWALRKSEKGERDARLAYLTTAVERYKNHPALKGWQVENEAMFDFGVCPKPNKDFLKQEISLVKQLDATHLVSTTDSGELALWTTVGSLVDRLGVSTYRLVRSSNGMVWKYSFLPTYWYSRRALLINPIVKDVYISEFQMEPWGTESLAITPIAEQVGFFSHKLMLENFDYAEKMHISEVHFWGVEWWWWMKTKNNDSFFWDAAKNFFVRHAPPSP